MNLILILSGVIVLFILFILFTKINVSFVTEYKERKFDIKLRVYILFRAFGKDIKFSKKPEEKKNDTATESKTSAQEDNGKKTVKEFISDLKGLIKKYLNYKDAYFMTRKKIRKKFVFRSLELSVDYGDGNAYTTAIAAGGMWGFIYNVLAFITKTATVKKHRECVNPRFNQKLFVFRAEGIFAVRPVHIIYALILFKSNYRKILKLDTGKKGV